MTEDVTPDEIKHMARSFASLLDCGKIIIPKGLAKDLREFGAWDDESMHEQQDIPCR